MGSLCEALQTQVILEIIIIIILINMVDAIKIVCVSIFAIFFILLSIIVSYKREAGNAIVDT